MKKAKSKSKANYFFYAFVAVVFISAISGLILQFRITKYIDTDPPIPGTQAMLPINPDDFKVVFSATSTQSMKTDFVGACSEPAFETGVSVFYTEYLPYGVGGMTGVYDGGSAIFITKGIPLVNVVAHEVSHLVDHIVSYKGINDTETRAYLQGYFTNCVLNLIQDSQVVKKVPSDSKYIPFKFSN